MVYFTYQANGRLANNFFQYLYTLAASIHFNIPFENDTINYAHNAIQSIEENSHISNIIEDAMIYNKLIDFQQNIIYSFNGYWQYDEILLRYKNKIKEYIQANTSQLIRTHLNYNIKAGFMLYTNLTIPKYDVVLHVRLDDFGKFIHPDTYKYILSGVDTVHIVLEKPNKKWEEIYLNYMTSNYNCIVHHNSLEEDYHTMKNANILICSMSTLSWIAAFWNDTATKIYMPRNDAKKDTGCYHGYFQYPSLDKEKISIYDWEVIDETGVYKLIK
jgi:hypothetical protein